MISPQSSFKPVVLAAALAGLASSAHAQLQWLSYDSAGNLVSANAGTGGEGAGSVDLLVPAGQKLTFITRNFSPVSVATPGTSATVNFTLAATASLTGASTRVLGFGLYNTASTTDLSDDAGLFQLWNPGGPYVELYSRTSGADLFTGAKQGQGGNYTGTLVDATTYNSLVRVSSNGAGTGVALGTGGGVGVAGIEIGGSGVDQRAYINPVLGMATSFDEFAVMFDNTLGEDEVTLTIGSAALTASAVPEPATGGLVALGLGGLLLRRAKSRKN